MAIKKIIIKGFRSIKNCDINNSNINLLIGRNGSGKSNFLSALIFFYQNLLNDNYCENIFDANNIWENEVRISVTFSLSKIRMICNSNKNQTQYSSYYKKILSISANDEIVIELCKNKGEKVIWNQNKNIRQIIYSLFPLYLVDSRCVELRDWGELWNLIGDYIKLENAVMEETKREVRSLFKDKNKLIESKLRELENILKEQKINLTKLNSRQFGSIITKVLLDGDQFSFNERGLNYFSNGTNAYNYTKLLIDILGMISYHKLKDPIVLLDEPEISLHHIMIDHLVDNIFDTSEKVQFFISTHSARFVKDVMVRDEHNYSVFNATLLEKYTYITPMNLLEDAMKRERVIINDSLVNAYFSKVIVCVEGESELELFQNKYLCSIFPHLRMIDLIKGMSNQVTYNIVSPKSRGYKSPAIQIIDMDKVFEKKDGTRNIFNIKEFLADNKNNEIFHYGKRRKETLQLRKRIEAIIKDCKFSMKYPFFSSMDLNFVTLIDLVKQYLKEYNIYVMDTTIEGGLITYENRQLFCEFLLQSKLLSPSKITKFIKYYNGFGWRDQVNYLRLICNGKSDFLLSKKKLETENPGIDKDLMSTLNTVKKTSGWIYDWLEYYFCKKARIDFNEMNKLKVFKRKLEEEQNIYQEFKYDFPELFKIIEIIRMTLEKNDDKLFMGKQ